MGKFNSKSFNGEAFKYLVDRVPNLKMNEIKKSKALVGNPDIKAVFSNQDGTGYAKVVMRGLADGDAVNYDGATNILATNTKTFEQGVVVVGRAKGWVERDFSYDITGGIDFMQDVANQIAEYKDGLDQDTILSILKGIFSMSTNPKDIEFVSNHTNDICAIGDGKIDVATLNKTTTKACGANKKKFSLVFMHSDVAMNIENLRLLEHLKYTDKDGVTRDLDLGTWNGKLVVVDDDMPVITVPATAGTAGVYKIKIDTALVDGQSIIINGRTYKCTTAGTGDGEFAVGTASQEATALATLIGTAFADFTVSSSTTYVVFTQIVRGVGNIPSIAIEGTGAGTASISTTTQGVAPSIEYKAYITYALGLGAINYEDIGVKIPYEMARDAKTNGGEDTLYIRQRKCFAPFGLSYTKASQSTLSPTNAELETGANWELVHTGETDVADRSYINHKSIAIARIVSKG